MEENFSTGEFCAGIVYLTVAARLFRRGLRNGQDAERILAGLFLAYGLSSLIYSMGTLSRFESSLTELSFAGRMVFCPTVLLTLSPARTTGRPHPSPFLKIRPKFGYAAFFPWDTAQAVFPAR